MISGRVYTWPRLIGGPLHGQPIPDTPSNLIGYAQEPTGAVGYYHEIKHRFGIDIAIKFFVYEGPLYERQDELMKDVIIHALATVGITVKEER